jgi:hypothetical protein
MTGEGVMKRFARRTALVALVWLTAASTLLAGVPHFECVCPSGRRGSSCLGVIAKSGGCCCGGSCCSAGGKGPQAEGQSCCGKPRAAHGEKPRPPAKESGNPRGARVTPAGKANPDSAQLHRPTCAKAPVQPEALTFAPASPSHAELSALDLSVPLPVSPGPEVPSAPAPGEVRWLTYCLPPPTDRVIVLQHFLI